MQAGNAISTRPDPRNPPRGPTKDLRNFIFPLSRPPSANSGTGSQRRPRADRNDEKQEKIFRKQEEKNCRPDRKITKGDKKGGKTEIYCSAARLYCKDNTFSGEIQICIHIR